MLFRSYAKPDRIWRVKLRTIDSVIAPQCSRTYLLIEEDGHTPNICKSDRQPTYETMTPTLTKLTKLSI